MRMRTLTLVAVLVTAVPAAAKPWQGIDPGSSKKEDILKKFGEPSRSVTANGKEVLGYFDKQAIPGTKQAQFQVDPGTQTVERIDVFPGPVIERETVESSYGPACPSGKAPATPCYLKRLSDEFRTIYVYPKLGLFVFFNEDGKTVHSISFTTPAAAK